MPTFKYEATTADSKKISGKISAESKEVVIEELHKRALTIISVEQTKEAKKRTVVKTRPFQSTKIKPEDIVVFTRQLATMIDAGLPIIEGLSAMKEQLTNPMFKHVIGEVCDDIQHGTSLAAAFGKHPKVFDNLFVSMVKIGESGGVLSEVLDRMATYMEKSLKLKGKVKSALTYPIAVVAIAVIISVALLVKVVPTFSGIYDSFDQELPAMTQVLISISDALKTKIGYIIGGIFALFIVVKQLYKVPFARLFFDRLLLNVPVFGSLLRKVAISRFSRTLATLIESGVPILESLTIVQATIGNKVLENVVEDMKKSVKEGEMLATPLDKTNIFPPMVKRMIGIGEKSGQMEKMLNKVSEFYDNEVDAAVDGLTSIIEPLIIGFLGIVIGFIVVALFLPILNISALV